MKVFIAQMVRYRCIQVLTIGEDGAKIGCKRKPIMWRRDVLKM